VGLASLTSYRGANPTLQYPSETCSRSHALRGNACLDALRRIYY